MSIAKSRKVHFLVLALIASLLLMSACGKTDKPAKESPTASSVPSSDANASTPAPSAPSPSESESANETVTYKAFNGDVTIPKNPKRIIDLTGSYAGYFLALGIQPIAATQYTLDNPYFNGKMDGVENLGDGKSVEKILSTKPDLIFVYQFFEAPFIEQLEKIAPVIVIEYGKLPYREQLLEFGKITGKEAEAEAWIAAWDQKIAENKPKVQAVVGDKTVAILQPFAKGIYAIGHNYARGGEIIYGEFQLKAPKLTQEKAIDSGVGWAELSLELLPQFAGDYIFTSPWGYDGADPKVVYDSKVWKNLPAVKNNRVFQINEHGAYFNDPVSLEAQLDFILKSFLGN